MDTKARIKYISLLLFITVFSVWVLFYFIISQTISDSTQKQIALASGQIVEQLGDEFAEVERLSYHLTQDENVKTLMREQDSRAFYTIAANAGTMLDAEGYNADFINSVVLYGADGHAHRLAGTLGNKACAMLYSAVSLAELPRHLDIELDGEKYIGYADRIMLGGTGAAGAVVVLIEEEKILEVMSTYDQSGSLLVMIRSGGDVIAANTQRTEMFAGPDVNRGSLGITPYEILVAADTSYMNASMLTFSIVAIITAAIFAAVLFLYTSVLNRRFFRPMVSVIDSITQLQTGTSGQHLPHVQSEEFDNLIDKINEMLLHIETQNMEVRAAELRANNAELEKQKALVFSLKKQINAHFTVNTLEAIRAAVEHGQLDEAKSVMSGLMRLVRYAHDRDEFINIWDELEVLQYYAAIMNNRYGGKLAVEFDFEDALMDYKMPRMLLQPILENAIVHGFKDMDSGCLLSVKAELRGGTVQFSIADNGCGMGMGEMRKLKRKLRAQQQAAGGIENIALVNITNRLYGYYGDAAGMDLDAGNGGGLLVTLCIPSTIEAGGGT